MTQNRLVAALVVWILAIFASAPIRAHEQYRMVGTLTKIEPTKGALFAVTIRFKWNQSDAEELSAVVYVWNTTKILKDDKEVPVADLKPGLTVVIDALGDDYNFSDAQIVRIVPPRATTLRR